MGIMRAMTKARKMSVDRKPADLGVTGSREDTVVGAMVFGRPLCTYLRVLEEYYPVGQPIQCGKLRRRQLSPTVFMGETSSSLPDASRVAKFHTWLTGSRR